MANEQKNQGGKEPSQAQPQEQDAQAAKLAQEKAQAAQAAAQEAAQEAQEAAMAAVDAAQAAAQTVQASAPPSAEPQQRSLRERAEATGLVPVRMAKPWRSWRAKEVAGFRPDIAKFLLQQELAVEV